MFNCMLDACINADDDKKAMGIWTLMQEEDWQPSEDFLRKLGKYLTDKNQVVPFEIPEEDTSPTAQEKKATGSQEKSANVRKSSTPKPSSGSQDRKPFAAPLKQS